METIDCATPTHFEITSNCFQYSYIFLSFLVFMLHPQFIFNSVDLILLCWYGPRKDAKFTVYVPAIRLFQRYKTMNANTVTASNGPTMKYHCRVVLAEKNKKILSHYRSSKHERPAARQVRSLLKFICHPRLSKNNNSIKRGFWGYSCHMLHSSLLYNSLSLCLNFFVIILILN